MLLWHYTSVDVLASIFAKEPPTLRASHVRHLNDSAELKLGLKAMIALFENKQGDQDKAILNVLEKMLDDEFDPDTYIFCLSECEDSLYQWIAYCPAQGGIALGFELPELTTYEEIKKQGLLVSLKVNTSAFRRIDLSSDLC